MTSHSIPQEVMEELTQTFSTIDLDGNGFIEASEIGQAFQICGETVPGYRIRDIIRENDLDENGKIDFKEFVMIMNKRHAAKEANQFRNMVKKRQDVKDYGASSEHANTDIKHSVSSEEQRSFADWINRILSDDGDLKSYLPLSATGSDIYNKSKDGVLLCKVINKSAPNTIDERAINKGKLNVFKATENLNLAINSARSIGCNVVNIGWQDIAEEKPHLILGLMWQLIKMGLLSKINLTTTAELAALLQEGETLADLMRLSPEQLLLRWVNYHMEQAGCPRRITNFSGDISDSEVYGYLLPQIAPAEVQRSMHRPMAVLETGDHLRRASLVLENAEKLDAACFVTPKDIVNGNANLNLAFVANLFNTHPSLDCKKDLDQEELLVEESREEKTYRNWMNSLGVSPFVNHLYSDLNSGIILFQIYDNIRAGLVEWKRVNMTFSGLHGRFKKIENCNYAVELGKNLKFSLVGIGGEDIHNENQTLTLALIWQMMRAYTLSILSNLSGSGDLMKDSEIVDWANTKLEETGKSTRIRSFKDPCIKTSHVVLDLIDAIRPGVIRMDLVEDGGTEESQLANAKYALSCARKAGAQIYALPEDLVEVKPKMTLTIFACLMTLARQLQCKN